MFIYHFNRMIRNKLLWVIFAIVIAIAFLSVDSCFMGSRSTEGYAGKLGKEKITLSEYNMVREMVSMQGADMNKAETETQIWEMIAALRTADKMGLRASAEEVRATIKSIPYFQQNGVFSMDAYTRAVASMGSFGSIQQFEAYLANDITLRKLSSVVGAGSFMSQMEVDAQVAAITDKITFKYATIEPGDESKNVAVDDAAVKAYYDDNTDSYKLQDRVAVKFASLPVSNFLASVTVPDDDIADYYDSNPSKYTREGTNGVEQIALDEVKDDIRAELAMQEAAHVALTNLYDFVESLSTNDIATFEWRAKAKGMTIADAALFDADVRALAGVEADAIDAFKESALELDALRDDSRYGVAEGKEFVYIIGAVTNDPAHVRDFEEVKALANAGAVREATKKAFDAKADDLRAKIVADVASGKAFAEAAAAYGLNVSTSVTFTAQDSAIDPAIRRLTSSVVRVAKGDVSDVIASAPNAVVAFVEDRVAADDVAILQARDQVRQMYGSLGAATAFKTWLSDNLKSIGYASNQQPAAAADDEAEEYDEDEE